MQVNDFMLVLSHKIKNIVIKLTLSHFSVCLLSISVLFTWPELTAK